jgi:hypothetical protein
MLNLPILTVHYWIGCTTAIQHLFSTISKRRRDAQVSEGAMRQDWQEFHGCGYKAEGIPTTVYHPLQQIKDVLRNPRNRIVLFLSG